MKAGPTPKLAERRQRHGKPQTLEAAPPRVAGIVTVSPPEPPANLPPLVAQWWNAFWSSDLAPLLRATDLPVIHRLFQAYADRERVRDEMAPKTRRPAPKQRKGEGHNDFLHRQAQWRREEAMTEWVIHDDRGGVKASPLYRIASEIESTIVALEDRLAMSPAARAKLGLAALRAQTLAEHNAQTIGALPTEPDDDDPRQVLRLEQRRTRRPTERGEE